MFGNKDDNISFENLSDDNCKEAYQSLIRQINLYRSGDKSIDITTLRNSYNILIHNCQNNPEFEELKNTLIDIFSRNGILNKILDTGISSDE